MSHKCRYYIQTQQELKMKKKKYEKQMKFEKLIRLPIKMIISVKKEENSL